MGKLLKFRAKGVLLQGLRRLLDEHTSLKHMEDVREKVNRGDVLDYHGQGKLRNLPGYAALMTKHFIPLLEKAKERLVTCLILLKFENVLTEFVFEIQSIFLEISQINLWMLEHGVQSTYKYLKPEDLR